jgi:ABC-type antimicrobial peptide transport system permease subunit
MARGSFVAMPQVTARTREIATMRALGFSRPAVFGTFVASAS